MPLESRALPFAAALATILALACAQFAGAAGATTPVQPALGGPHANSVSEDPPTLPDFPPCLSLCEPPPKVEGPDPEHSLLVISVGWDTGDPYTSSPIIDSLNGFFSNYLEHHLNEYMLDLAPPGAFVPWQVSRGGTYEIEPPHIPQPYEENRGEYPGSHQCTETENRRLMDEIAERAEAKARQGGIDPSPYALVVVQWDQQICFGGKASGIGGGRRIALVRTDSAIHEFGHRLGLTHADALRCRDAAGSPVPLSGSCDVEEYGDPYDAMGGLNLDYGYNAPHEYRLGWLNGRFFSVEPSASTRSFTLAPLTDTSSGRRALRLTDPTGTYWLEYRTGFGVDDELFTHRKFSISPGVLVHRELPGNPPTSQLLDMTPGSGFNASEAFTDAPLSVGASWAPPGGDSAITVVSVTPTAATVTISSTRKTVPNLVDLTKSQALAAIAAAGLTSGGTTSEADLECNFLGKVMRQTPVTGTSLPAGGRVAIVLGVEDRKRGCK